jgi:pilus assembly protein CpaB
MFAVLAAMAAVLAAVIVFSALKKREAEVQRALASSVPIVVAAHDLPLGAKIGPNAIKLARWPRDSIPPGAFTDPQPLMNDYVKSGFVANEPIVSAKLYAGQKTAGVLPLLIPSGMRAMSVPVDEVSDIAGFVQPLTHVDVLVAVSGNGSAQQSFSKIVLQDVEVLAVAQEIEGPKDKPQVVKVVTLLVTPAEAEKLTLASREGMLRLAMRNYSDRSVVATAGIDLDQLLHGGADGPTLRSQHNAIGAARTIRPSPYRVEILRDGRSADSVSFVKTAFSDRRRTPRRPVHAPQRAAARAPAASSPPLASAPASKSGAASLAASNARFTLPSGAPSIELSAPGSTRQRADSDSATQAQPAGTRDVPAPKTIEIP